MRAPAQAKRDLSCRVLQIPQRQNFTLRRDQTHRACRAQPLQDVLTRAVIIQAIRQPKRVKFGASQSLKLRVALRPFWGIGARLQRFDFLRRRLRALKRNRVWSGCQYHANPLPRPRSFAQIGL